MCELVLSLNQLLLCNEISGMMSGEGLGVCGLHGVGDAGEQGAGGFFVTIDTDAEPAGGSGGKDGLGQARGGGGAEEDGVGAVFGNVDLLGLGPERIATFRGGVDAEDELSIVSGAGGELAGVADLLGND